MCLIFLKKSVTSRAGNIFMRLVHSYGDVVLKTNANVSGEQRDNM